jgi:hypothetical protein
MLFKFIVYGRVSLSKSNDCYDEFFSMIKNELLQYSSLGPWPQTFHCMQTNKLYSSGLTLFTTASKSFS